MKMMDRFLPLSYLDAQVAVEYLDMAPPAGESRPNENSEELTECLTATLQRSDLNSSSNMALEEQRLSIAVVK